MDLMENKPTLIQVNSGLGITYYKHIIAPFTDACISYQASLSANNGLGMKQMSVYPSVFLLFFIYHIYLFLVRRRGNLR